MTAEVRLRHLRRELVRVASELACAQVGPPAEELGRADLRRRLVAVETTLRRLAVELRRLADDARGPRRCPRCDRPSEASRCPYCGEPAPELEAGR